MDDVENRTFDEIAIGVRQPRAHADQGRHQPVRRDVAHVLGIDGPLAFDDAVSEEAARIKSIASPVAGKADILLVPDLEAGSMLVKQLGYLAGAQRAGIVLGARVPIILTSRAEIVLARMAFCAVALVAARRGRPSAP